MTPTDDALFLSVLLASFKSVLVQNENYYIITDDL